MQIGTGDVGQILLQSLLGVSIHRAKLAQQSNSNLGGGVHSIEVRESEFTWRLCRSEQQSLSAAGCKCRSRWTSFEYRRDLAPSEPVNRRCSAMRPATCR